MDQSLHHVLLQPCSDLQCSYVISVDCAFNHCVVSPVSDSSGCANCCPCCTCLCNVPCEFSLLYMWHSSSLSSVSSFQLFELQQSLYRCVLEGAPVEQLFVLSGCVGHAISWLSNLYIKTACMSEPSICLVECGPNVRVTVVVM
jgi:hypothetical protein